MNLSNAFNNAIIIYRAEVAACLCFGRIQTLRYTVNLSEPYTAILLEQGALAPLARAVVPFLLVVSTRVSTMAALVLPSRRPPAARSAGRRRRRPRARRRGGRARRPRAVERQARVSSKGRG